jgi:hypothetical protein
MCQHHHDWPWATGGETEVEWMSLLCNGHHRKLSQGWQLERLPDRRMIVHPPQHGHTVWGPAIHDPPAP